MVQVHANRAQVVLIGHDCRNAVAVYLVLLCGIVRENVEGERLVMLVDVVDASLELQGNVTKTNHK